MLFRSVHACCMVFATLVANGAGRRRHGVSALFVTMSIFLLLRPTVLFEMGFQLSCASVFAILCFCPYATYALGELGVPTGIAGILSVTLCSQLATAPITVPAFGTFSLIAPIANAVIGPVVSVLLAVSIALVPCSLVPLLRPWALVMPMVAARCALFFDGEIISSDAPNSFFAENNFYTTAANRIARPLCPTAITSEEAAECCRGNGEDNG